MTSDLSTAAPAAPAWTLFEHAYYLAHDSHLFRVEYDGNSGASHLTLMGNCRWNTLLNASRKPTPAEALAVCYQMVQTFIHSDTTHLQPVKQPASTEQPGLHGPFTPSVLEDMSVKKRNHLLWLDISVKKRNHLLWLDYKLYKGESLSNAEQQELTMLRQQEEAILVDRLMKERNDELASKKQKGETSSGISTTTTPITVRIDRDTMKKLDALLEKSGRTLTFVVRRYIDRLVEAWETTPVDATAEIHDLLAGQMKNIIQRDDRRYIDGADPACREAARGSARMNEKRREELERLRHFSVDGTGGLTPEGNLRLQELVEEEKACALTGQAKKDRLYYLDEVVRLGGKLTPESEQERKDLREDPKGDRAQTVKDARKHTTLLHLLRLSMSTTLTAADRREMEDLLGDRLNHLGTVRDVPLTRAMIELLTRLPKPTSLSAAAPETSNEVPAPTDTLPA